MNQSSQQRVSPSAVNAAITELLDTRAAEASAKRAIADSVTEIFALREGLGLKWSTIWEHLVVRANLKINEKTLKDYYAEVRGGVDQARAKTLIDQMKARLATQALSRSEGEAAPVIRKEQRTAGGAKHDSEPEREAALQRRTVHLAVALPAQKSTEPEALAGTAPLAQTDLAQLEEPLIEPPPTPEPADPQFEAIRSAVARQWATGARVQRVTVQSPDGEKSYAIPIPLQKEIVEGFVTSFQQFDARRRQAR